MTFSRYSGHGLAPAKPAQCHQSHSNPLPLPANCGFCRQRHCQPACYRPVWRKAGRPSGQIAAPLAFPINRSASRAKSSARQRLPKPKAAGSSSAGLFAAKALILLFRTALCLNFLPDAKRDTSCPSTGLRPTREKPVSCKARADAPIIHQ